MCSRYIERHCLVELFKKRAVPVGFGVYAQPRTAQRNVQRRRILKCFWENERTATPVRAFAVRLTRPVVRSEKQKQFSDIRRKRSHQAIFQWVHRLADSVSDPPSAAPSRVAVDETAVKINSEWSWVYATIDTETKLLLGIKVFDQHGTDQAAAFLSGLAEKHDLSDAVFLVDGDGYRTALFRIGLSGHLDYTERNLIEKWFHTLKPRIDRFYTSWVGSRPSVQQWLEQFVHYYNHQTTASIARQPNTCRGGAKLNSAHRTNSTIIEQEMKTKLRTTNETRPTKYLRSRVHDRQAAVVCPANRYEQDLRACCRAGSV